MALKSLGNLTLDLIARVGNFTGPIDKAKRKTSKDMKELQDIAKKTGAVVAAGLAAGAAGLVAMIQSSRTAIDENAKLAQALGGTVAGMDALARAGGRAGVSTEELRAASQRLNQALGVAIQRGGPAADTLRRLGLNAQELSRMDVDQRFAAISNRMRDMGLSTQLAAAELRNLGIRQSSMITLMQGGGSAIEESRRKLEAYGVTLSDIDAAQVESMNDALDEISIITSGLSKQMTVQFAPVIELVAQLMSDAAVEAGGMGNVAQKAFDRIISGAAFVVDAADGIKRAFTLTADGIIIVMNRTFQGLASAAAAVLAAISKVPGIDYSETVASLRSMATEAGGVAEEAWKNINDTLERPMAGTAFKKLVEDAKEKSKAAATEAVKARKSIDTVYDGIEDGAKEAKKAQDQLLRTFEQTVANFERQIALYGDTTEAQRLMYEIEKGNLVGINAEQQKRLVLLASELDLKNELAKSADEQKQINTDARGIADDMRSAEERILASYEKRRDIVLRNTEITGQAQSDLLKKLEEKRNEELLEINGTYWEKYLIAAEKNLQSFDQLAGNTIENFSARFGSAFESMIFDAQTLEDTVLGLAENMARSIVAALGEMAAQWLAYQAVQMLTGKTAQASAAATMTANASAMSVMAGLNAFASTAAIPIVGPPAAPAAMAAATAATAPMVAAVSSLALSGMAHDGIDKVPQTGTWLLEKGERVMTAETSAKMDRTLDQVVSGGSRQAVNQNIYVTGSIDRRTSTQMANDTARKQRMTQARLG